jgi:hypothetical protein
MKEVQIKRPTLGPFMSVVCFRYLHDDAMDLAGQALVVDAGRQRGNDLIHELGAQGTHQNGAKLYKELDDALGMNGTRLCLIQSVKEMDNGGFEVHSKECASPTYTLGVLIGAISAMVGKTFIGKELEGASPDERVFQIEPF